jgi:hypothetical protein
MTVIYHPETQGSVEVPPESLHHYRQSGWVTREEWAELERLRALQAAPPGPVLDDTAGEDMPAKLRRLTADKESK